VRDYSLCNIMIKW